jgi:hypothetical protein
MIGWKRNKWNPIKFIKRTEVVRVMLWGKMGRQVRIGNMIKDGDFVRDPATDLTYGPTRLRPLMDKSGNAVYNAHMESGCPLTVGDIELDKHIIDPRDGWSATTIYDEKGNEIWMFEEESRRPARIEFSEVVIKMITDPETMSVITCKTMLSNALNRSPSLTILLLTGAACLFLGILIGGAL